MISCLLVEDQTLVRLGFANLLNLSDVICVEGQAENGEDALNQLEQRDFDVVLLDMRMPVLDGLGVLRALQNSTKCAPPILIITTFEDCEVLVSAMALGAKGYVLKNIELEELIESIKQIVAGRKVLQPALTDYLLQKQIAPQIELTDKERQVLTCLSLGMANKTIARNLHNSEGTIRNHVSNILAKLEVQDRTQAVLKAIELGLV